MNVSTVVRFGLLLWTLVLFSGCSSKLFYTRSKTEWIDIRNLEHYAAHPEESPYTRSIQYSNKEKTTMSYILTARKTDSLQIVVWKKKGIYTNIMRIEVLNTQYIRTRFDATGREIDREVVELEDSN